MKNSLIVELDEVDSNWLEEEKTTGRLYKGVNEGNWLCQHDFVLVTEKETYDLRDNNAIKAMGKLGLKAKLERGIPMQEVDVRDIY